MRQGVSSSVGRTMGIFASDAQGLEDVLSLMEHPRTSFKALKWYARIPLGGFLLVYLPLAFMLAVLFEVVIRRPYHAIFKGRRDSTKDQAYWTDMAYASPVRKILMVHLQEEILRVQLDGTSESLCEKGARSHRTSWLTGMTVTWLHTNRIHIPPSAVPSRMKRTKDSSTCYVEDVREEDLPSTRPLSHWSSDCFVVATMNTTLSLD